MNLKINYGNMMNAILIMFYFSVLFFAGTLESKGQNIFKNSDMKLPDILVAEDGRKIKNIDDWENIRRPEILELFETYVYGKIPNNKMNIRFKVIKENNNALFGNAISKEVIVSFSNGIDSLHMNILIFLPKHKNESVPLFLGMNFYGNHTIHPDPNISITPNYVNNKTEFCITDHKASHLSRGVRANRWPVERIIERGYGLATIYYGDMDPDYHDEFQNGIHKLFDKSDNNRNPASWGAISAWAYGISKAMDYFEIDTDIDHKRVAVIGHSRLGKTALWAGAMDQRFALTISNNSGCGGAALSRRKTGETLSDINSRFPHWFCKNFHEFNNNENNLPVDQHMLLALISPRPVYIASAVKDKWADPQGEYLSLYYAGPAYNLYNEDTLDIINLPELNTPKIKGKLGYHIRSGGHDLTKYDWERYMDFADIQLLE